MGIFGFHNIPIQYVYDKNFELIIQSEDIVYFWYFAIFRTDPSMYVENNTEDHQINMICLKEIIS